MSSQPFPCTWYARTPRTIAAASAEFAPAAPAVWCTTAKRTAGWYFGGARRSASFALQAERVMIVGEPATASRRSGMRCSGA
jgi:hypothetical protein